MNIAALFFVDSSSSFKPEILSVLGDQGEEFNITTTMIP